MQTLHFLSQFVFFSDVAFLFYCSLICSHTCTAVLESSAGKEITSPSLLHWTEASGYDDTSQEKMTSLPLVVTMSRGA